MQNPILGHKGCLWAQAFIWYCQFGEPASAGDLQSLNPILAPSGFTSLKVMGVTLLAVTSPMAVTQSHAQGHRTDTVLP